MATTMNFTTTLTFESSALDVFEAIVDVRRWWTGEIEGESEMLGDEFTYRYPGHHVSKQRVIELVPGRSVVWRVVGSDLNGYENASEWTGTEIRFAIASNGERSSVVFTHQGLSPEVECHDNCSSAWGFYLHQSLKNWITTGIGPTDPPW